MGSFYGKKTMQRLECMQRPHPFLYNPRGQVQTLSVERLLEIMLAKQRREHGAFHGREAGDAERQRNDLVRTNGSHDK